MLDKKFWKKYFEVYDVLNMVIPYQELLDTVVKELEVNKGDKVLEAGCGTGNLCIKLKEAGADVIGLDNVKEALDIYKKKDPKAKTVLHDLTKPLPFPNNYFDKIACNNTLYAIPVEKRAKVVKEFYRILKPKGRMVIVNPLPGNKPILIYKEHLNKDIKNSSFGKVFVKIIGFMISTIRMFIYNRKIIGNTIFSSLSDQKKLLAEVRFKNISTKKVYAKQAIAIIGEKNV